MEHQANYDKDIYVIEHREVSFCTFVIIPMHLELLENKTLTFPPFFFITEIVILLQSSGFFTPSSICILSINDNWFFISVQYVDLYFGIFGNHSIFQSISFKEVSIVNVLENM